MARAPLAARRPRADPAARMTPVPDSLAQQVLDVLMRDTTARLANSGGGGLAPGFVGLLQLLDAGARRHRGEPPLETDPACDGASGPAATGTLSLSVSECAARMGCSGQWVRFLITKGRLPARQPVPGGPWIVLAADFDAYRTGRSTDGAGNGGAEARGGAGSAA